MSRIAASILYIFVYIVALDAQEFTGVWRLSDERPEVGSLPERPAGALEISEDGKIIRCKLTRADALQLSLMFTTDGKESKTKDGDRTLSTAAKWEGSSLLVNTIVNGPASSHTQMDHWRVNRAKTRLTIRREIVRRYGNAESTLIYVRAK